MLSNVNRRNFLQTGAVLAARPGEAVIEIDPAPRFDLSPYLYMQFMEPLGVTDSSVEAAWDRRRNDWREDVVSATADLAPGMMRWGGIFSDYYRWREGVGPRAERKPMVNLLWGGVESNQVGTAEFVSFSRRVGAEPLICVNFSSDGRDRYQQFEGSVRTADAPEAGEWVAYCNRRDHAGRRAHGFPEPHNVRYWQIGNETSYDPNGFDLDAAARKTVEFSRAMRKADPGIKLIGWGGIDKGARRAGRKPRNWMKGMAEAAGEYLNFLAFHHMYNPDDREHPVLAWGRFREDPARTWEQLMDAWKPHDEKIRRVRENASGTGIPLAMTECHFSIPGRNRCEVLSTWAAGVSYARLLNVHERHGEVLKIATAADFCGTRWQNNALMIPVPGRRGAFLMPVAHVMRLYRKHGGEQAVAVRSAPPELDVTASRSREKLFLHVVNTERTKQVRVRLRAPGFAFGKAFEIAADPMLEMRGERPGVLAPVERTIGSDAVHTFPAASVTAVEAVLAG